MRTCRRLSPLAAAIPSRPTSSIHWRGPAAASPACASTVSTKRLAVIKQAVLNLQRVAMLWNRDDLGMTMRYEASAGAARSIGVIVQPFGVREPNDFDGVFEAMARDRPEAILLVADV